MNGSELPPLSREQLRAVDQRAVDEFAMHSLVLMENAGRGAAERIAARPEPGRVVICCGAGNNGGDGCVIARHLEIAGVKVHVLLFATEEQLSTDTAANWQILAAADTPRTLIDPTRATAGDQPPFEQQVATLLSFGDLVVDALLGTGVRGAVREPLASVIRAVNGCGKPVLSIDLPSGLDCDTGTAAGDCVRASETITFVARKKGFEQPGAAGLTGTVHVVGIGVPLPLLRSVVAG